MMNADEELAWDRGYRAAMTETLRLAVLALGYEGTRHEAWILEREATVAMLRIVCAEHGDNDWPNDLHLADVIEKHLERYLEKREP